MIIEINKGSVVLMFTLLMMISSCNSNVIFTDSTVMPHNNWSLSNIQGFSVPINDTINASDISFTIRTGSNYPFRNIYLFVTATAPDGKSLTDTLEYDLADVKGNWYGKGFGDIHELNLSYKTNVFFPVKGTYQFKIQHGMRIGNLDGVYDFGLRIEKRAGNN